jgi:hypothetical protein
MSINESVNLCLNDTPFYYEKFSWARPQWKALYLFTRGHLRSAALYRATTRHSAIAPFSCESCDDNSHRRVTDRHVDQLPAPLTSRLEEQGGGLQCNRYPTHRRISQSQNRKPDT